MSSSRRASREEALTGVGGKKLNLSRAGSASSVRSSAASSTAGSGSGQAGGLMKTTGKPTPDSGSAAADASAVSCHFRYTGCHLLVIVSDGCDMLRQEAICAALQLNDASGAVDGNQPAVLPLPLPPPPPPPPDNLEEQLKTLDAEWTRKFIEHVTQQIAKGKWIPLLFYSHYVLQFFNLLD